MTRKLLTTFIILITCLNLFSQQKGYEITVKIDKMQDSLLFLAGYYGDKNTLIDTAYPKKNDKFVFKDKKRLEGGIYFLVNQDKKKLFEFIIDNDQDFILSNDTIAYTSNMQIKGSKENQLFYEYVHLTESLHQKAEQLNKELQAAADESKQKELKAELQNINDSVNSFKEVLAREHPDHILALIFKSLKQPEIPDTLNPRNPNYKQLQYLLFKDNYWDNIALHDPRIIRTPVFYNKLSTFFDKIVYQQPDSIIKEIDVVLAKADTSDIVHNYLVWYFVEKFDHEEIMGFDKIFVHIAKTYFNDSTRINTSKSVLEKIRERADKIEPLLLGKPAPNLILMGTGNKFDSFYNLENDYVIIFFWDYDCGVCRKEVTAFKNLLDSTAFDIGIFSVCTDTNLKKWKSKIKEYEIENWLNVNATRSITANYHDLYDVFATPLIFILNRKKEIIAKKIAVEQIDQFLKHYDSKNK